jgi:hypothetical protein
VDVLHGVLHSDHSRGTGLPILNAQLSDGTFMDGTAPECVYVDYPDGDPLPLLKSASCTDRVGICRRRLGMCKN